MKYVPSASVDKVRSGNQSAGAIITDYSKQGFDERFKLMEIVRRFPIEGRKRSIGKTLAYVVRGRCRIFIEDREVKLEEKDAIRIDHGERFFWETQTSISVVVWKNKTGRLRHKNPRR